MNLIPHPPPSDKPLPLAAWVVLDEYVRLEEATAADVYFSLRARARGIGVDRIALPIPVAYRATGWLMGRGLVVEAGVRDGKTLYRATPSTGTEEQE